MPSRGASADIEAEPARCHKCGSRHLGPVRSEDAEVGPSDPDMPAARYEGVLECLDCGELIDWEP